MTDCFLALDKKDHDRMFVQGEARHHFMPGFFNGCIEFKETRDWAVYAALRSHTSTAKQAPYQDTTWLVLHFKLDDADFGWLSKNGWIKMNTACDGYDVLMSISQQTDKEMVRWPRVGEEYWLVNHGFPVSRSPSSSDGCILCTKRDSSQNTMYEAEGGLVCHYCLLEQEMSKAPLRA